MREIEKIKNKLDSAVALGLSDDEVDALNSQLAGLCYPEKFRCVECESVVSALVGGLCGACAHEAGLEF